MTNDTADVLPIANEPTTGSMREHLVGALTRVVPQDIRIATAYLTPDGFLELKDAMDSAHNVRLLLGERPFMNRRGPGDVLSQPGDYEELHGPAESVDWYTFLEGGYPWLLLTHEERRELLARGVTPEAAAFDLSAWERVTALADYLRRDSVEVVGDSWGPIRARYCSKRCWTIARPGTGFTPRRTSFPARWVGMPPSVPATSPRAAYPRTPS